MINSIEIAYFSKISPQSAHDAALVSSGGLISLQPTPVLTEKASCVARSAALCPPVPASKVYKTLVQGPK